jgi:hypothetical protein
MTARTGKIRDRGSEGLSCPVCNSTAHAVTDSRGRGGRIWRRRMCANRHRFSTVELVDDDGRSVRLNGLTALLDGLSAEDFVMVGQLAARLAVQQTADGNPAGQGSGTVCGPGSAPSLANPAQAEAAE